MQMFTARMAQSLVPQEFLCLFLDVHGVNGGGVVVEHGSDGLPECVRQVFATVVELGSELRCVLLSCFIGFLLDVLG